MAGNDALELAEVGHDWDNSVVNKLKAKSELNLDEKVQTMALQLCGKTGDETAKFRGNVVALLVGV